ncbi:hypothetical protein B0H11DRAFT_2105969 [Mycena galericulata]|nr:hypothetical protein B0H11DRAFT_2105969 [Mycena galericulata]
MPRRVPILIGVTILPVALLGTLYYQHRRLQRAYPTLRVPPALEISARRDKPAFGMSTLDYNAAPSTTGSRSVHDPEIENEHWMRTDAGDMWAATVPRCLLSSTPEDLRDGPLVAFSRAFWGTWPLRVERRIVHALARLGVLFQLRGGQMDAGAESLGEEKFAETSRILGGLFVVEAHDRDTPPKANANGASGSLHGPLVTSWWLRPTPKTTSQRVGILGGYHSFAVEDLHHPPESDTVLKELRESGEPYVRLFFVSHLILSAPDAENANSSPSSTSIPSDALRSLSPRQRLIMHFHALYARILLDLAVRELGRRGK